MPRHELGRVAADAIPAQRGVLQLTLSQPPGCLLSRSEPCGETWAAPRSEARMDQSVMAAASQGQVRLGCKGTDEL